MFLGLFLITRARKSKGDFLESLVLNATFLSGPIKKIEASKLGKSIEDVHIPVKELLHGQQFLVVSESSKKNNKNYLENNDDG